MAALVRTKWLDKRKWRIDDRILKWSWGAEERKQWKKNG